MLAIIQTHRKNLLKILVYQLIFIILHYLYDFLPILPIELISGINESNFQHWKIGFYSYLILVILEYIFYRADIKDLESFIYSRLLTAWLTSWLIFTYWYIPFAIMGSNFDSIVLEVIWSNIALLATSVSFCILDTRFEALTYDRPIQILIIILIIITVLLFTAFTYAIPWADVFVDPTIELIRF